MIVKCNCGKEFYMRPSDYKRGRRHCSRSCSVKYKNILRGNESPNWKGNNVGYAGVHAYIKKYMKHKGVCECCGKETEYLDLANISQDYKRDFSDWEYLCRKCHMIKDGRIKRLSENSYKGRNSRWDNRTMYSRNFPFKKLRT